MAPVAAPPAEHRGPFRRDGWKRPLVLQPGKPAATADELPYVRASGVSDFLEDKTGVHNWKVNGAMWAVAHDPGLQLSVAAVPDPESPEGKSTLRGLFRIAEQVSGMTAKREAGTALHALFELVDRRKPLPATVGAVRAALDAYAHTMSHFVVHEIELPVVCDELGIAGTLDKTVSPLGVMIPTDRKGRQFAPEVTPDDVIVADVKTSASDQYFGVGFASQLGPYARSVAYWEVEDPAILAAQREAGEDLWSRQNRRARVAEFHRRPHGARTDVGLIVHVPSGGTTAELYWLNLTEGYEAARHAMGTREWRSKSKSLCSPAALPVVAPAPVAHAAAIASGLQQAHARRVVMDLIGRAGSRDECVQLYQANRRIWTDEHHAAVKARLAVLAAHTAAVAS